MTASELNACRELQREIERERRRLESLREASASITRILDGLPKGRPTTSRIERFSILIFEAEERLSNLQAELDITAASLATRLINELSAFPLSLSVMLRHYVGQANFNEIARQLHYTRTYIWNLHNRGLDTLGIDRPKRNCQKSARF